MTRKRDIYLEDLPMTEAVARLNAALERAGLLGPMPGEEVPLAEALGRVTAAPVWAAISAPHYHASAMDGYAARSRDTQGASETSPVTLHLLGDEDEIERVKRPAQALNTGHALPAWADSVIMVENVQPGETAGELIIRAPVAPWQHVRPMGEDMVATELVLPANHSLRPVDLGALGGSGHASVSVRRRPRVAVIPTGSELVSAEDVAASGGRPAPGKIVEFNSLVLAAQIESWGALATRWPIVPDEDESIKAAVVEAASTHDLVLINAGSSAGTEDWTAQVIRELGEVLVHGVAVRPGHPVIFGVIGSQQSAVSNQLPADSEQQSADSNKPSAISHQPSASDTRNSVLGTRYSLERPAQQPQPQEQHAHRPQPDDHDRGRYPRFVLAGRNARGDRPVVGDLGGLRERRRQRIGRRPGAGRDGECAGRLQAETRRRSLGCAGRLEGYRGGLPQRELGRLDRGWGGRFDHRHGADVADDGHHVFINPRLAVGRVLPGDHVPRVLV
jgi:molybdenum cofactor synthesis domain-containing protein